MKKHIEIYRRYFGADDFYPCEICTSRATDVHQMDSESNTKCEIEDIMALCGNCLMDVKTGKLKDAELRKIHNDFLEN